jgi:hypothetical protein
MLVVAAGIAAAIRPRLGLAIALAIPVFPFGNEARSAAVLYGAIALGLLALGWRDARAGLLFVSGPLLAPFGALALVPLAVQPAPGAPRRAVQGAVAVLAAVLVSGVTAGALPVTGTAVGSVGIAPLDSPATAARAVWHALFLHPIVPLGAVVVGLAASVLPSARRVHRYGVAVVGLPLIGGTIALGASIASCLLVAFMWALAAAVAARSGR